MKYYQKADKYEFFPTEKHITDKIYSEIDKYNFKKILDPCCGSGNLEKFNDKYEYTLYDIVDRGVNANICNFLEAKINEKFDCCIVNPPFSYTLDFVNKIKNYTNDIFIIAPIKTIIKNYSLYIKWYSFDIEYSKSFKTLTSIGLFHLSFKNIPFGTLPKNMEYYLGKKLDVKDSWKAHFFEAEKAPNKYFIVDRLTKARVIRGQDLITVNDLYNPGDDSAFIAQADNINVRKNEHLPRNICTFDSLEEMKKYVESYKQRDSLIRNYLYLWGSSILGLQYKPW